MFEDLVPLSTQLVTPALAEAFDIPTARASVPDSQLVHHANPGSGQTKSSYQLPMYNVRSNAGSAQQAQQGAKYYAQPAQPSNPHQDSLGASLGAQGQGGLARQQLQGMGGPGMSQGMYGIKYEDPGAQGYMGLAGQYPNWMDQTTSASGLQPPQTSAKPLEQGTGGSDDPDNGEDYQARALKRPRLVWTAQLHQRFVDAVKQLGLKNAVPKTIMQLMNVDGLTRENVASHLQKYRLQLRKEVGGVDGDNAEDDNLGEGDAAYS